VPTVPRYGDQRVGLQGLPNARVSVDAPLEAFGGGQSAAQVSQATEQVGRVAVDLAMQEKQKADDTATQEAYAKTIREKNRLMYDTDQNDPGAAMKKGKDSFGTVDEYGGKYQKFNDDVEASLANDTQRAMFKKIRLSQENDLNESLQRHVFAESRQFEEQTFKSGVAAAREDGVLNYQKPGSVDRSLADQRALIIDNAQRNGLPPEVVKMQLAEASSKTQSTIVERMLANGQDLAAKNYFDSTKDQMTSQDVVQLEKAVEEGSIRGESQRKGDAFWLQSGGDLKVALGSAKKIEDPKVREATEHRLRQMASDASAAERQSEEKYFNQAADIAEQTQERPNAVIWANLNLGQRNAIDNRIEQLKKGIEAEPNGEEYYNLRTMASTPQTKERFLQTDIRQFMAKMTKQETHQLIELQAGMRSNDPSSLKTLDGFRGDAQIVNDTLLAAGVDPTPKAGSNDAKNVALFRRQADDQQRALQEKLGRKATNEEMQAIVDNLIVKGVTSKGWLWDTKKSAYQLTSGETIEVSAKDVPRGDRIKIEEALRKNNRPVTDKAISDLYNRKIQKMVTSDQY